MTPEEAYKQPNDEELIEFDKWCKERKIKNWDFRINPIRKFLDFRLEQVKFICKSCGTPIQDGKHTDKYMDLKCMKKEIL